MKTFEDFLKVKAGTKNVLQVNISTSQEAFYIDVKLLNIGDLEDCRLNTLTRLSINGSEDIRKDMQLMLFEYDCQLALKCTYISGSVNPFFNDIDQVRQMDEWLITKIVTEYQKLNEKVNPNIQQLKEEELEELKKNLKTNSEDILVLNYTQLQQFILWMARQYWTVKDQLDASLVKVKSAK